VLLLADIYFYTVSVNIVIRFIVKIMMRKYEDVKCKRYKGVKKGLDVVWIVCKLLETCVVVLGLGWGVRVIAVAVVRFLCTNLIVCRVNMVSCCFPLFDVEAWVFLMCRSKYCPPVGIVSC
jgi:hypothetical protein